MLKTAMIAAFIAVTAVSLASAGSQDLCNDAHMKQMDEMIAKMTDAEKKKAATMHLDMSKAEMKKGNTA
jgi:agmatine/peptidylarginine deiminase